MTAASVEKQPRQPHLHILTHRSAKLTDSNTTVAFTAFFIHSRTYLIDLNTTELCVHRPHDMTNLPKMPVGEQYPILARHRSPALPSERNPSPWIPPINHIFILPAYRLLIWPCTFLLRYRFRGTGLTHAPTGTLLSELASHPASRRTKSPSTSANMNAVYNLSWVMLWYLVGLEATARRCPAIVGFFPRPIPSDCESVAEWRQWT